MDLNLQHKEKPNESTPKSPLTPVKSDTLVYEKLFENYITLSTLVFSEYNLVDRAGEILYLKGKLNSLIKAVVKAIEIKSEIGDECDVANAVTSLGILMRFRMHADAATKKQIISLYTRLLTRKFVDYKDKLYSLRDKEFNLGKLVFISGMPRAGNSIFANLGSNDFVILDEPASWESGGINKEILDMLLLGKNVCIIRPNFMYVMPGVISLMRNFFGLQVASIYLSRNLESIAKSYLKRSLIARKTNVNWSAHWNDAYALFEYTDHIRLYSKESKYFAKTVSYDALRSSFGEWRKFVLYLYSLVNAMPDDRMISSTYEFNSNFVTDTPPEQLELLRSS